MTVSIGPNFGNELIAAGLGGLDIGWSATETPVFGPGVTSDQQTAVASVLAAHDPGRPDPNRAAPALLAAGIALTSTGTSALDGAYACDPVSQQNISSEALYVQVTTAQGAATFSNGETTMAWYDSAGTPHTFTCAQFIAFAQATARFVSAVKLAVAASMPSGVSWTPPSNTITIA